MHICIVGTGASGWMTAHYLASKSYVTSVTIVGSEKIPPIGVGESTTINFMNFLKETFNFDLNIPSKKFLQFLVDIDAAFKYGVSYEGWSEKKFIHQFVTCTPNMLKQQHLLGKKPKNENVNDYISSMASFAYKNEIYRDYENGFLNSIHFDANCFIKTMEKLGKENNKISYIKGTAVELLFDDITAKTLILNNGDKISADYFISCIGQTAFNQQVFKEKYKSYNDILLTNTAVAVPVPYSNKVKQFHPYTVAKTMKHGWRWITPTWSRIGSGYTFSKDFASVDETIHELLSDIKDFSLNPFVVDFYPRKALNPFKKNTCTIGMAAGFLEPLDAPGLSLTVNSLRLLDQVLEKTISHEKANDIMLWNFDFWVAFILLQYKTSIRNDSKFWKEQKNVKFTFLEELMLLLKEKNYSLNETLNIEKSVLTFQWEPTMLYNTLSGKDITWEVCEKEPLIKRLDTGVSTGGHYNYFMGIHELFEN